MNTKFEFADKFGFEPKFSEIYSNQFENTYLDIKKVFMLLGANDSDYLSQTEKQKQEKERKYQEAKQFSKNQAAKENGSLVSAPILNEVELVASRVPFKISTYLSNQEYDNRVNIKGTDYYYGCEINTSVIDDYIDFENLHLVKRWSGFYLYVTFEKDRSRTFSDEELDNFAAIKLGPLSLSGLVYLLEFCKRRFTKKAIENIYEKLAFRFMAFSSPETSISLLPHIPKEILIRFDVKDLNKIFDKSVDHYWLFASREKVVNYIIEVLSLHPKFNPNTFLSNLLSKKVWGKTIFEKLYTEMNNVGLTNSFDTYIKLIYNIWASSKYINSDEKVFCEEKYSRVSTLAYTSDSFLGFNYSSHDIEFHGDDISSESHETSEKLLFHVFQPITLNKMSNNDEIENMKVQKNVAIPAFYLKAFDDKGDWENVWTLIEYIIDVASLLVGIGHFNLLLKATKSYRYIKLAFGGLEIASAGIGIAINLTRKNILKGHTQKLQNFLFWFDLCTLSGDALSRRILRNQASAAQEAIISFRKENKVTTSLQKQLSHIDDILGAILRQEAFEYFQRVFSKKAQKIIEKSGLVPTRLVDDVITFCPIKH